EYETSTNSGATWSAPTSGASLTISAEGETLVRFRSVDGAGNVSGWVGATVRIDRTPPSDPSVSGGSAAWQSVASVTISAAGSPDALSGVAGYEFETSTDAGATWSAPATGASLTISAEGETLVRFQAVDSAGNSSAWVSDVARIDRTAPTD